MAATDKFLKKALNGPAPQYYDEELDDYEVLRGRNGGSKVVADDGAFETFGKTTDSPVTDPTQIASEISLLKGLLKQQNEALEKLNTIMEKLQNTLQVAGTVSVSNFPTTQQVTGTVQVDQGAPASDGQAWPVRLTEDKMSYYGATIDDRPAPTSVPVGATFMAVSTQQIWQSNGTEWVEV